jgi:hypothetical protein
LCYYRIERAKKFIDLRKKDGEGEKLALKDSRVGSFLKKFFKKFPF